jgi:cyclopropane-fatty-acyl-phospholipid synthase
MSVLLETLPLPDAAIRMGIRARLRQRLGELYEGTEEERHERTKALIANLRQSPIAIQTEAANEQHYELPPPFFEKCLGPHLKYSCCYWDNSTPDLGAAEKRMLDIVTERAQIVDGQRILDLGCGWGSFALHAARNFPNSEVVGFSNSAPQREFILGKARAEGLSNVEIITGNVAEDPLPDGFDRIVSNEMFEHMRNYDLLFAKCNDALVDGGKMFVHIFTHRAYPYLFEVKDDSDWMAKYFFSGGIMPHNHLFHTMCSPMVIKDHWIVDGTHYQKTADAWLANMDSQHDEILPILADVYGQDQAAKWRVYWRTFYMACSELWGYNNGTEWLVNHYLFSKGKPAV